MGNLIWRYEDHVLTASEIRELIWRADPDISREDMGKIVDWEDGTFNEEGLVA